MKLNQPTNQPTKQDWKTVKVGTEKINHEQKVKTHIGN